jgi:PKHD-type hydroxylase
MLVHLPAVLSRETLALFSERLADAPWGDGRVTAGVQSGAVKDNLQLAENSTEARDLGEMVLAALDCSPRFWSAALPARVYPPLFNKYESGMGFGSHIDNAIRKLPGTRARLRTDLSATLFLSRPESYDGGELVIETGFGIQNVKLAAGDMVLYPATSQHHVRPVTRGVRLASFFWIQSMVGDDSERALLFDLDQSVQALGAIHGANDPDVLRLTGLYHNLVRKWGAP